MGGTAVKGKPQVLTKTKITLRNSSNNLNSTTGNNNKILAAPKKIQSTGAVNSFKNTLSVIPEKFNEFPNSHSKGIYKSPTKNKGLNPIKEIPTASRNVNKKQKAELPKVKNCLEEKKEMDVLKIIKKNNHEFADRELINDCLDRHFFMRCLDDEARTEIIKEMSLCKIEQATYVFKQDSMGNFFYIIKEGECDLFINENHIKTMRSGESFGELALLHGAPRSGSVKTKQVVFVWCMERRNFRKIVDHINYCNYEENKKFVSCIPMLMNIENDMKSILSSNLIKEFYDKDKVIVKGIFS